MNFSSMTYINDEWKEILGNNNLRSFDDIWHLDANWFEPPNKRRGGWSGVSKIPLVDNDETKWVFLKRQENHLSHSIRHPLGIPTLKKEFLKYQTVWTCRNRQPVTRFFWGAKKRCILITEELVNYISLSKLTEFLHSGGIISRELRHSILESVAQLVRRTHAQGLLHNSLYPKHVFIKAQIKNKQLICAKHPHARYIDLEKAKRTTNQKKQIGRDLAVLFNIQFLHLSTLVFCQLLVLFTLW